MALHNLPVLATSFIGREREKAEILRAMAATRLLTLTGAGGTGKTRLSLETARQSVGQYPGGVWFVQLAGLTAPELVPQAVATALGLQESGAKQVDLLLPEFIGDKELLVVLDNCEHLIGAAAALTDSLLGACPGLRILATSREPLAIPWETVWPVPPLSLDDEGVELFLVRARSAKPSFEPTPAVGEICRRLDGLPLAIELAAARVRVLTPEQIAERLDDTLHLLTGGSRTSPPRQQTMRAAIDWSYTMLAAPEQALFRQLSVFAGGFTLDAAEAVAAADNAVLDHLSQLVDKSLVISEAARYRLLEPIRQYALEQLAASGGDVDARTRHLSYFSALGRRAYDGLMRAGQIDWLKRLDAEHDNVRAALDWSLEHDPLAGLRLVGCLGRYWPLRGRFSESRRWYDALLARCPEPTEERALALLMSREVARENPLPRLEESHRIFAALGKKQETAWTGLFLGSVVHNQGDPARARLLEAESRAIFTEMGDQFGLTFIWDAPTAEENLERRLQAILERGDKIWAVRMLTDMAGQDHFTRSFDRAGERLRLAIQLATEVGDKQGLATAYLAMGDVASRTRDYTTARETIELALQRFREIGDQVRTNDAIFLLGRLAVDTRRPAEAMPLLTTVLQHARALGLTHLERNALVYLALAHLQQQELDEAQRLAEIATEIARRQGSVGAIAWCLRVLGIIEGEKGRYEEALRQTRESLSIDVQTHAQKPGFALNLAMTGVWLIHSGRHEQGVRLIAAANACHPLQSALDPLEEPYVQPALDRARSALGQTAYDRARATGATAAFSNVIGEAMGARHDSPGGLTARELEIVRLVARGLPDREVAAQLFISPRTVDTHLRNIFTKVGVDSRTALTAWAIRSGI